MNAPVAGIEPACALPVLSPGAIAQPAELMPVGRTAAQETASQGDMPRKSTPLQQQRA